MSVCVRASVCVNVALFMSCHVQVNIEKLSGERMNSTHLKRKKLLPDILFSFNYKSQSKCWPSLLAPDHSWLLLWRRQAKKGKKERKSEWETRVYCESWTITWNLYQSHFTRDLLFFLRALSKSKHTQWMNPSYQSDKLTHTDKWMYICYCASVKLKGKRKTDFFSHFNWNTFISVPFLFPQINLFRL